MKNGKWIQKIVCLFILILGFSFCLNGCGKKEKQDEEDKESKKQETLIKDEETEDDKETIVISDLSERIKKDSYRNQTAIHDACLFKDGNLYYAFGSHMAAATSTDLWNWEIIANGVTKKNKLFQGLLGSDAYA